MSMTYTNYVIYGYDLTDYIDMDKLEDWKWEEGEKYFCNQRAGYIQIFDGGADGGKVYLGYIIWTAEEYDYEGDAIFNLDDLVNNPINIFTVFIELYEKGILDIGFANTSGGAKIICFREYS